ncbi:aminotransferase class III-fold pyridoxal phosphate-dependent enzyme [Pseudomonas aeruginosa]
MFGSGGVIVPPAGYHRRMWDLCQRYDVLYISDEVVTSFGCSATSSPAEAVFGQPDIILTVKGLTSGYQPLGASSSPGDLGGDRRAGQGPLLQP